MHWDAKISNFQFRLFLGKSNGRFLKNILNTIIQGPFH